jgi:hypothetical protein
MRFNALSFGGRTLKARLVNTLLTDVGFQEEIAIWLSGTVVKGAGEVSSENHVADLQLLFWEGTPKPKAWGDSPAMVKAGSKGSPPWMFGVK